MSSSAPVTLYDQLLKAGSLGDDALLSGFLDYTAALPQAEAACALGMDEGAVKVAIHRLRRRFRELVRAEVAQTVPATADVDAELRYLVEVLVQG